MSGRISRYLNQRATWGRQTGTDSYGVPIRTTDMIECRIQKSIRLTQDSAGRDITSTMTVYIAPQESVSGCEDFMGGTMNGMPIQQVAEMIDSQGRIVGYEVML